jgi:hypothetical protein
VGTFFFLSHNKSVLSTIFRIVLISFELCFVDAIILGNVCELNIMDMFGPYDLIYTPVECNGRMSNRCIDTGVGFLMSAI